MQSQTIAGIQYNVGDRYDVKKLLGAGAYGHVALAYDRRNNNEKCAIKKLHKIEDVIDAKRVLREIRILRNMNHENVLNLLNLVYDDTVKDNDFGHVYLVTNYMEVDLYKIIKSGQNLTDQHMQYILYQLLKGLKYLHSANIVHRDIKPSNILATENCEICFCDFGLARKIEDSDAEDDQRQSTLTEYVVTRYYRAPEVMLSSHEYTTAIDIWSLGCAFAELLTRQILFKGTNYIQMIKLIFETLGKPPESDLLFITNANAKKYVQGLQVQQFKNNLKVKPRTAISQVLKYSNPEALDLLDKLLEINPKNRLSAEDALKHPYLEQVRDPDDEPTFEGSIDCEFEKDDKITLQQLKVMILEEINTMKKLNKEQPIDIPKELERCHQIGQVLQSQKGSKEEKKKQ